MGFQQDFEKLPASKVAIVGIVLAGIYYMMFFDGGSNYQRQAQKAQTQINEMNGRLSKLQETLNNKEAFQKEVNILTANYEKLLKYFPVDIDMNKTSKEISLDLESFNNEVKYVKQIDIDSRFPGYSEQGIEIRATGDFHSVMGFLASLTQIDKVVDFKEVLFDGSASSDEASNVKLDLTLSLFSQQAGVN